MNQQIVNYLKLKREETNLDISSLCENLAFILR